MWGWDFTVPLSFRHPINYSAYFLFFSFFLCVFFTGGDPVWREGSEQPRFFVCSKYSYFFMSGLCSFLNRKLKTGLENLYPTFCLCFYIRPCWRKIGPEKSCVETNPGDNEILAAMDGWLRPPYISLSLFSFRCCCFEAKSLEKSNSMTCYFLFGNLFMCFSPTNQVFQMRHWTCCNGDAILSLIS